MSTTVVVLAVIAIIASLIGLVLFLVSYLSKGKNNYDQTNVNEMTRTEIYENLKDKNNPIADDFLKLSYGGQKHAK